MFFWWWLLVFAGVCGLLFVFCLPLVAGFCWVLVTLVCYCHVVLASVLLVCAGVCWCLSVGFSGDYCLFLLFFVCCFLLMFCRFLFGACWFRRVFLLVVADFCWCFVVNFFLAFAGV